MPINNINSLTPPFLKKGDVVEIIASSKFVNKNDVSLAIQSIEAAGFNVRINSFLHDKKNKHTFLQQYNHNKNHHINDKFHQRVHSIFLDKKLNINCYVTNCQHDRYNNE